MTSPEGSQVRERLGERVSAATYGTVLVMAALPLIDLADIRPGVGWALVSGVSGATFVAHAYAQIMGDHVRRDSTIDRKEVVHALRDGVPILLAAIAPALALGLGQTAVLAPGAALWVAFGVALLQLVGLGLYVGWSVRPRPTRWWTYGMAAAALGVIVAAAKFSLGH